MEPIVDTAKVVEGLARPFRGKDLEWRIQRAGVKKSGEIWAIVVPYVDARAIFDRLDQVVGPANWQTALQPTGPMGKSGGMTGGIGVKFDGEWIWKWDAAQASDIEPVKGAASGAIKRAAVQLGMGRDLYGVGDLFAKIHDRGRHFAKVEVKEKGWISFNWDEPVLAEPAPPAAAADSETAINTGPPTVKQAAFYNRLLMSHVFTAEERERAVVWLATKANRKNINDRIDHIKSLMEERKAAEEAATSEGADT